MYDSYELALPIISTNKTPTSEHPTLKHIFGTCFSIGVGFFLTAGHVGEELINADIEGDQCIAFRTSENALPNILWIGHVEVLENDIAIIAIKNFSLITEPEFLRGIRTLPWTTRLLRPLDIVRTHGYPYGVIPPDASGQPSSGMLQRSFQGHIVSSIHEYLPFGIEGKPFPVIETSFNAPRGLSGAPIVFVGDNDVSFLAGVVLGNSQSSMIVHDSEEYIQENGETIKHTIEERLSLGLATRNDGVLGLNSNLLGRTIEEHLNDQKRIVEKPFG